MTHVWLSPAGFDEYMLGYQDRSAISPPSTSRFTLAPTRAQRHPCRRRPCQGVWRRTLKKKSVLVTISPFTELPAVQKHAAAAAAERYARFLGLSLALEWQE
jgi:hypothetical protein